MSFYEEISICLVICFLIFSEIGTGSLAYFLYDLNTFFFSMYSSGFLIISSISSNHLIKILRISGLLHLKLKVFNSYSENLGTLSLNFFPIKYLTLLVSDLLVNISTIFLLKLGYYSSTFVIRVLNNCLISLM